MKNIVVVSAHPDDEILGAGGTLLKHKNNGDKIFWIISTSIFSDSPQSEILFKKRNLEIAEIQNKLNIKKTFLLNFETTKLNSTNNFEIVTKISEIFKEIEPEIIYCVNRTDAHSDHKFTFDGVMSCTKSFRHPYIKKVLLYECISETEHAPAIPERIFQPNYFVNISDYLKDKLLLMNVYSSELGNHPFPRSIENIKALATFRGSICGFKYAEAFQLIKCIED